MREQGEVLALLDGMLAVLQEVVAAGYVANAVNVLKYAILTVEHDIPNDVALTTYRKHCFRSIGRPDLIDPPADREKLSTG